DILVGCGAVHAGELHQASLLALLHGARAPESSGAELARSDVEMSEAAFERHFERIAEPETSSAGAALLDHFAHRACDALGGGAARSLDERRGAAHVDRGVDAGLHRELLEQRPHRSGGGALGVAAGFLVDEASAL